MSDPTCSLYWCSKPLHARGLCANHYHAAMSPFQGEIATEARALLLEPYVERWICECPTPSDVTAIGECMACRRPVIGQQRVYDLVASGHLIAVGDTYEATR